MIKKANEWMRKIQIAFLVRKYWHILCIYGNNQIERLLSAWELSKFYTFQFKSLMGTWKPENFQFVFRKQKFCHFSTENQLKRQKNYRYNSSALSILPLMWNARTLRHSSLFWWLSCFSPFTTTSDQCYASPPSHHHHHHHHHHITTTTPTPTQLLFLSIMIR